ncbi:FAD/NAD(P)-binding domain-containing protein [Epithele typhae]|uniref:FAD/NAD(P)-binding domain-containing protein n=1 Tax=Epithele typhae TaxID=378194 RepID=UPI0020076E4E|nr:FAD/NAD(P)-binding domain-containing protein [Epithele typhae]KAH9913460.1 FAD/NAD(P)-binding domain-containing protein [Epithele typhae]
MLCDLDLSSPHVCPELEPASADDNSDNTPPLAYPTNFMGDESGVLSIDFVIAGGSLCGLSAAIALRRVGHNVIVVDRSSPYEPTKFDSGIRLPPNSTKHYYRWGLKERLHAVSVKSQGTLFASFYSGAIAGKHSWADSILEELGGDTLCMHYTPLRKVLAEYATEMGVNIIIENISSVHPDPVKPSLTLESGDVLTGDVVLGADGYVFEGNVCRTALLDALGQDHKSTWMGMHLFSCDIPGANLARLEDKDMLAQLQQGGKVFTWYGSGCGALGFPMKSMTVAVLLRVDELLASLKDSNPQLQEIAQQSARITVVPMANHSSLDEWAYPGGRLLCIGEGAHPTPVGSLFSAAMCTCDAACLGRLFSHLTRHDQIDTLLYAVQEIREGPVASVFKAASGNIFATSLPPGIVERDDDERARAERGLASLGGGVDSLAPSPEMIEVVEQLFGYDAEDEADNWWVNWGLMQERAMRRELSEKRGLPVIFERGEGSGKKSLAAQLAYMAYENEPSFEYMYMYVRLVNIGVS